MYIIAKRTCSLVLFVFIGLLTFCYSGYASPNKNVFSTWYNDSFLEKVLPLPETFIPVPSADNECWRKEIPYSMREDYIKLGELYAGDSWENIDDSIFAEYSINGNRSNFESQYFEIRRKMACLVMAEIFEYEGRFINNILGGLRYFKEETWWGVPAHYPKSHPVDSIQIVDLFNAETANLLAWTVYMMGKELEKIDKNICKEIRKEIDRRILIPARVNFYSWKKETNNWNPWVCSNWLSCILLCEKDRENQLDAIKQILNCINLYYNRFPADGYCDEGVVYWTWGVASLYFCMELLGKATNGGISLAKDPKLEKMGRYVTNLYIGNQYFVNFEDSRAKPIISPHVLIPFGAYINDSILIKYGMYVANQFDMLHKPASIYRWSGNFPSISRELLFLYKYNVYNKLKGTEPLKRDVFFESSQICVARSQKGSKKGLLVASKGGHNGENHNHNDVGNYIVYGDGHPILIDIGMGTYNAKTFGPQRYELFNCRSAYHNVPLINGAEQRNGEEFRAEDVSYIQTDSTSIFSLDIAHAYPKDTGVTSWKRIIRLNRGKNVEISEDYLLSEFKQPSEVVLICIGSTQFIGKGTIIIQDEDKSHYIYYNPKQMVPHVEAIESDDSTIREAWDNKKICRVKLEIIDHALKNEVTYIIE